jgi:hypothetical protein
MSLKECSKCGSTDFCIELDVLDTHWIVCRQCDFTIGELINGDTSPTSADLYRAFRERGDNKSVSECCGGKKCSD